jgi:predicted nucleic acid-binding protein
MKILLDTNILLRISEPRHPHHAAATKALRNLATSGHTFAISSQTVYEFLAVATRATADRGLGMSQNIADGELSKLILSLPMLYDSAAVVTELRRLMLAHSVAGKSIHDAHIVATMTVHGIADILTFNGRDFARFAGVQVRDPNVEAAATP